MHRRNFLALSGAGLIAQLTGCGGGSGSSVGATVPAVIPPAGSTTPLPIPPVLTGTSIDLSLQTGSMNFLPGKTTQTWGINGNYLGPAIRVRNGDAVTLRTANNLAEPVAIHWHGMHIPAQMDGGPHQAIQPGATWNATFTVRQRAGTNWFHPHTLDQTGRQVYMGLAGLLIVDDEQTDALDLPKTWGEDDIPLVIQDRRFRADGSFDYLSAMQDTMVGMLGDVILVNGAVFPQASLPAKEIRFRILNGSNARVYRLAFTDGRTFMQIATDTALVEAPVRLTTLMVSPGERAEIVVDCSADYGKALVLLDTLSGASLVTLSIDKAANRVTKLPTTLTTLDWLEPTLAVKTRTFVLSSGMGMAMGMAGGTAFQINGKSMDINRIDEVVPLNAIEVWEIRSDPMTGMTHSFHIHGTHFTILERNGSAANIPAHEKGYKDTVMLNSGDVVKVILQMTDYTTSANAPYMYHCHILEHEDRGMMGQFAVT